MRPRYDGAWIETAGNLGVQATASEDLGSIALGFGVAMVVMVAVAWLVERLVLGKLVNQEGITLLMALVDGLGGVRSAMCSQAGLHLEVPVARRLKAAKVDYVVDDGGRTVRVPSSRIDEMRLTERFHPEMKVGFAGDIPNAVAEKESTLSEAAWASGLAFDAAGRLLVTDAKHHRVVRLRRHARSAGAP